MSTCIAVIHATRVAVTPIEDTFRRLWPEAETFHLLDESLSRDLAAAGELTPELAGQVRRLAQFGQKGGGRAILFSCSAFGEAIEAARASMEVPVLKPNEAMLEEALEAGERIRLLATYPPSLPSTRRELERMAARRGRSVRTEERHVPGALDALHEGRADLHDALIAEAADGGGPCDAVLLAQISMARALPAVDGWVEARVLASPESAVLRLKEMVAQANGAAPSPSPPGKPAPPES